MKRNTYTLVSQLSSRHGKKRVLIRTNPLKSKQNRVVLKEHLLGLILFKPYNPWSLSVGKTRDTLDVRYPVMYPDPLDTWHPDILTTLWVYLRRNVVPFGGVWCWSRFMVFEYVREIRPLLPGFVVRTN